MSMGRMLLEECARIVQLEGALQAAKFDKIAPSPLLREQSDRLQEH